jgi:hypothetical protein
MTHRAPCDVCGSPTLANCECFVDLTCSNCGKEFKRSRTKFIQYQQYSGPTENFYCNPKCAGKATQKSRRDSAGFNRSILRAQDEPPRYEPEKLDLSKLRKDGKL